MKLSEVMDIVREQVGRDALSDPALDWAIKMGLRELEKRDNFYWMEASRPLVVLEDQQDYSLYTDTNDGFNMPNFKETDALWVSDLTVADPEWGEVEGPVPIKDIRNEFATTDTGAPGFWTMAEAGEDVTISFWPPVPDQTYNLIWDHFQWTSLPTDVSSEGHEVLRRWPEALIYLATKQGLLISKKDPQLAAYWETLFDNPQNPQQRSEYKRIKLYQQTRHSQRRHKRSTTSNDATLSNRRRTNERMWF